MNKKKAATVTAALIFLLTVIVAGLWIYDVYLFFGIIVGLFAIAGVAYFAALLIDWLTTTEETKELEPITILGDEIETPSVSMTADEIMEEFR